jgi:hypothetical protein
VLKSTWAIGGTELIPTKKGGWTEDAWAGAGSGCSAYITKPAVQTDENCDMRTVSDVSAVADSAEGFAVYDTYGLGPDNGWIGVGGTSLSSPLVAAMIGLAGNSTKVASPSYLYKHRSGLLDVVGGSNGLLRWRLPLYRRQGLRRSDWAGQPPRPEIPVAHPRTRR